jgi:hypothetical protein
VSAAYHTSVIIAVEHSVGNLPQVLARLAPDAHPRLEFLVCHKELSDPLAGLELGDNCRSIACAASARIPHMWRDGILAARGDRVALLSAHCVPSVHWSTNLERLVLPPDTAGIGGYFTNDVAASARDSAIFLLRYGQFCRPRDADAIGHIAADNAVYRRSAILECRDLVPQGFWETDYHRQFAARGLKLRLSSELEVIHTNCYTTPEFAAQRRAHGFEFGRGRARALSTGRLALLAAAAPAIPLVLLAKVVRRAGTVGARRVAYVAGHLSYFALSWGLGETRGLWSELRSRVAA